MLPDDRKRIRKQFKVIAENVRAQDIVDQLISDGVLDEEDDEAINSQTTTNAKTRELLRIILRKQNANAYEFFCAAVSDAGWDFVVAELRSIDITNEPDKPDGSGGEGNAEELRKQIVRQSVMMMDFKEKHDRELLEMRQQYEAEISRLASLNDSVDGAVLRDRHVLAYVTQLCAQPSAAPLNNIAAGNNGVAFPGHVWDLIMSNISRRRETLALSVEEESCRIGIDVLRYIVMPQHSGWLNWLWGGGKVERSSELMRAVVERELGRNGKVFDDIVAMLDSCELEGYATFETIADNQFGDQQCNWGRIVAWYTFWARLASSLPAEGRDQTIELFGRYVGVCLSRHVNDWIRSTGGWSDFVRKYCGGQSDGGGVAWNIAQALVKEASSVL